MPVTWEWRGLDELRAALRALPAELRGAADLIVTEAAEGARAEMVRGYPERSGHLRDHVAVTRTTQGQYGTGALVRNTSPHAWWFEHGTQARHTALGANRGPMPAHPIFVPAMQRHRAAMYRRFAVLLESHGLAVSGDA